MAHSLKTMMKIMAVVALPLGLLSLNGCTVKAKKADVFDTHGKDKKRPGLFTGKDGKMVIK